MAALSFPGRSLHCFAMLNPRFVAFNNVMNIMQQVAVIAVAAYGMTYVILLGEIDLSIGSIIAVAGMVAAQAFSMGFGFAPTVIFTLAAGAIMGGLNGVLSAKLMLPSFIVTVATMGIYRGMVSLPTNGAPEIIENETWLAIGSESWLGLPIIIWIVGVLFLVNYVLLSKTVLADASIWRVATRKQRSIPAFGSIASRSSSSCSRVSWPRSAVFCSHHVYHRRRPMLVWATSLMRLQLWFWVAHRLPAVSAPWLAQSLAH